ncbi:MAG: phosphoribosylformylglycinamidine synthase subunit PurQ [Bacillota bacterium]
MNFGVLVFPGSNCDIDMFKAVRDVLGENVEYVWHTETDLSKFDCILVPGGFSYGDYLRCGAIARFANVMEALQKAAAEGKYILGVCNGFQVLTESHLLPGALLRNNNLKFNCYQTVLTVENNETPFTTEYAKGQEITIPIAHGEGSFYVNDEQLAELEANKQIIFRYKNNPNGSVSDIAGVSNKAGNVVGMMPHPERAVKDILGSADGAAMFKSVLNAWREQHEQKVSR